MGQPELKDQCADLNLCSCTTLNKLFSLSESISTLKTWGDGDNLITILPCQKITVGNLLWKASVRVVCNL